MYGKLKISGVIEAMSGVHIGAGDGFSAIGAVDSSVIRDAITGIPMIPGSSIKGKMRTLVTKYLQKDYKLPTKHDEDPEIVKRVFGHSTKKNPKTARLLFSDCLMCNDQELKEEGANLTEVKFENVISRATGVANPRQIERAVRGTKYVMEWIYEMEEEAEVKEDFALIRDAMKLLEYDYIGGHGSRGYGKIMFSDIQVSCVVGEVDESILTSCKKVLEERNHES